MERIKKLIVVILCVGMISSLNISFIYASQSNGYHPLNIKIESPDVPKTVTPKRNARSLDSYYSSSELGQVTSVKDQGNTELCCVWDYIDGRDFSDQTRNRKYEYRFFGETFWIFYVQSKKRYIK